MVVKVSAFIAVRLYASLFAALTGCFYVSEAIALPFVVNEDLVGVWNNRIVVAAAYRAKDPDKQLVGFNNAPEYPGARAAVSSSDDGNLNYLKGDLISAPIIYATDLELRYRKRYGFYGKVRSWYDYAAEKREVPHGSVANNYVPDSKLDDSDYHKYNKFSGYRVADLYVYGNWDIGDSVITGRLGQQSINWGESLLHTGVNSFNPINFSALGRPGVRQDDALVPVNRIYTNLITRNGVSLEAFYALSWEESHISACGTLTGAADNITDPGCNVATTATPFTDRQQLNFAPLSENPLVVPRVTSRKPGSGGQYGFSSRYFVEALDTEFGLYYVNYHATIPVLDLTLCDNGWDGCSSQDGLTLPMRYQEDVKAFAISAATGVRNIALSAELSQFRDLPVQRNFPQLIEGATKNRGIYADRMAAAGTGTLFNGSWKADRTQLLLGGRLDLGSTIGLADASMAVEASGQWITNLPGTGQERIGRNGNWGDAVTADGVCRPLTQNTQGGCKVDGFATDFSWGYRMLSVFSLPRPARGVDLQTLVSWNHDVDGYAVDGSQVEGRRIVGLRLQALFQRTWFLEIGRTWVHSTTDYDIARDKDVYTIAAGLVF
jgi:hypothetical protein